MSCKANKNNRSTPFARRLLTLVIIDRVRCHLMARHRTHHLLLLAVAVQIILARKWLGMWRGLLTRELRLSLRIVHRHFGERRKWPRLAWQSEPLHYFKADYSWFVND